MRLEFVYRIKINYNPRWGSIITGRKCYVLDHISMMWQSSKGKRWLTHWVSMLRWRWSISEYNLMTMDSPKWTLKSGPFVREHRGSRPARQKPKHNPCRPVGRILKVPILISKTDHATPLAGNHRHLDTWVSGYGWLDRMESKGYPKTIKQNAKWYSPSQVWPQIMCLTHSWLQQYYEKFKHYGLQYNEGN